MTYKTYKIEVSSIVKKYIEGNRGQLLFVTPNDTFTKFLWLLIGGEKIDVIVSKDRRIDDLETSILVKINIEQVHQYRRAKLLNIIESCMVNKYWLMMLKKEFLASCKSCESTSLAIKLFRERYGFEEDELPENTLWTEYKRFVKGKNYNIIEV